MRVSPCSLLATDFASVTSEAERVSSVSHNHPDAVFASVLLAQCVFLALHGASPLQVQQHIASKGLILLSVPAYREMSTFSTDAASTIGPALASATTAGSFEEAMFNCISIGGDTDTICGMAAGLAEALYGIPDPFVDRALPFLPADIRSLMTQLYSRSGLQTFGIRPPSRSRTASHLSPRPSLLQRLPKLFR